MNFATCARARFQSGNVPALRPLRLEVLANIYKGRLEDLEGWALFNQ